MLERIREVKQRRDFYRHGWSRSLGFLQWAFVVMMILIAMMFYARFQRQDTPFFATSESGGLFPLAAAGSSREAKAMAQELVRHNAVQMRRKVT